MNKNLEKITKSIPIVYPIIIFLGYYNYTSYYRYFDIEIFPYLSIYEILFSIVSQLIPIFIIGFLLLCYLVFLVILPFSGKEKEKPKKNEEVEVSEFGKRFSRLNGKDDVSTSLIYNNFHLLAIRRWFFAGKKIKNKKYWRALSHLFFLFWNIVGVIIKISLWLFFFIFTLIGMTLMFSPLEKNMDYYYPFFTSQTSIIISILVWCAITYALISRTSEYKPKSALTFMRIFPLIYLMFLSITIYQKMEAERTQNHLSQNIKFEYGDKEIRSNESKVFVGKTADYIFIRDLKNKENYIYPVSDVKNLVISEIDK